MPLRAAQAEGQFQGRKPSVPAAVNSESTSSTIPSGLFNKPVTTTPKASDALNTRPPARPSRPSLKSTDREVRLPKTPVMSMRKMSQLKYATGPLVSDTKQGPLCEIQ